MFVKKPRFAQYIYLYYSLLKKPRLTQEHNMWTMENSVIHVVRAAQSLWMTDFSDLSTWMSEFSVTRILCSCVTLGFCNSALNI
jgi:hypothetical protein